MRFETKVRRPLLTLLMIAAAVGAWAARPRAALADGPGTLDLSGVRALGRAHQMGLLLIGSEDTDGRAARTLVKQQLEKTDREIRVLAAAAQPPPRALLAHTCLTSGIDAIALVRISPQGPVPTTGATTKGTTGGTTAGSRVITVQVRDHNGEPIQLQPDARAFWGDAFTLKMVVSDKALAAAAAQAPPAETTTPPPPPLSLAAPLLRIASDGQYLGTARLRRGELYDLAGHPDLGADYRRRLRIRTGVQVAGFGLLGGGVTALAAVEAGTSLCGGFVTLITAPFGGNKNDSGCDASTWAYAIPIAVAVTGGVILALSATMRVDPVDADGRAAMVRTYNLRVQESQSPSPAEPKPSPPTTPAAVDLAVTPALITGGGLLVMNGRF